MAAGWISKQNQDATVYIAGLDEKVGKPLLWELFLQAGPVVSTHMPKDRVTGQHQGYGFVEFLSGEDADCAIKIMNMIKLYGKPIRVNKTSAHNNNLDVGASIFINNLDPGIDGKLLHDSFDAFRVIFQPPKIMWDPDPGNSKGYAFINFASFDASDAVTEAMNRQYLGNRPISASYAFKDFKGLRHGSAAERLLAAQNPLSQADHPHQLFADTPPLPSAPNPVVSSLGSGLPPPGMPPPGSFAPLPCPPPPMPPGAGGHSPPSAGIPGAGRPGHGHSHPHPFPPSGMPRHPHAGPPGTGGHPPPQPPPGMPHPGPPPMDMPLEGPMPPHGMLGPPPLVPPRGYTGPPRPPPYGYQRGPLLPPRRPPPRFQFSS
ncbi:unnamed protein product [Nyctereutes procyonoides]|uniref:(raccoon dog) hypothetical protein n=1 Tax=Nyctereutes procyonoides TaxID=34880 RepID=A0A811Y132_NYCPR|nr:unnamed protein product [Nyctereutes procyonoides]